MRSERTTAILALLRAACCLKQTQSTRARAAFWGSIWSERPFPQLHREEVQVSSGAFRQVLSAAPQDLARRRVPALRSPGAMAAYLDSVLDFVSVELLGCALPRQKRVEPAVINPG